MTKSDIDFILDILRCSLSDIEYDMDSSIYIILLKNYNIPRQTGQLIVA